MSEVGRTILVVEDDHETLNVISRTLAAGGYDVVWARNGVETLKLLTRVDQRVGLMIVDVVLPGMSGPELVKRVRKENPGISSIFVSAHDSNTVSSHGVDLTKDAFLAKPYEPRELIRLVSERLS